jgi:hypothetical protein
MPVQPNHTSHTSYRNHVTSLPLERTLTLQLAFNATVCLIRRQRLIHESWQTVSHDQMTEAAARNQRIGCHTKHAL